MRTRFVAWGWYFAALCLLEGAAEQAARACTCTAPSGLSCSGGACCWTSGNECVCRDKGQAGCS